MENPNALFIEYTIQASDTLTGITLDFGVSKAFLKKHNNIINDEILHLKTLKLPNNEAVRKKMEQLNLDCDKQKMNEKDSLNQFVNRMKRDYDLDGETISDFYKLYKGNAVL